MPHQCGITYLALQKDAGGWDRTALGFVLSLWWGLWQDACSLRRIGEDRSTNKHINWGPRRPGPETRECFLKPLCVARRIKLGLKNTSCFHQRGSRLEQKEPNATAKGAEQCSWNWWESHERPACFCWEGTNRGVTRCCQMTPDTSGGWTRPRGGACRCEIQAGHCTIKSALSRNHTTEEQPFYYQKIRVTLWGQVKTRFFNCIEFKWQQADKLVRQLNPNTFLNSARGPSLSDSFLEVKVQNVHRNLSHPYLICFKVIVWSCGLTAIEITNPPASTYVVLYRYFSYVWKNWIKEKKTQTATNIKSKTHGKKINYETGNSRRRKVSTTLDTNLKSPHYLGESKIHVLFPICLSLESPWTNWSKRQILSVCEQLLRNGTNPFSSFIQYFRPCG